MLRSKKVLLAGLISICILGGWTLQEDDNRFKSSLIQIEGLVDSEEWDKASEEAYQLRDIYQNEKWKYQLLGDENNYKGIQKEMEKLLASISVEDKKQVKVETAVIRTLYKDIYFY
ncbi:hypothetical protein KO561_04860 [Radiobacillus kanasensis]|uniref:DUF4363 family protein n=1 Tax=Radiobacillus kanasensis TaxID=2844358 RepID=UPI001E4DA216|nr:hypothetical protein [Radiobacillus kanasensis]UFU00286.1 hypothetical protein KO561_04860 [Radiobacillus kanasensis]